MNGNNCGQIIPDWGCVLVYKLLTNLDKEGLEVAEVFKHVERT